ncbi:P-loop NTPase family protein [Parasporobacterium paucivorans]|uniref:Cellulose biosynthesis protein BcsQ n=1 Tax=Parasporobacterium paucivorans DSM 15970 TaxID=1122934 RepID=A0A1M6JAX1_9FIRM|nr:hypothetical protein [Parasporobacterium paucivorans]SHJ43841.1 hypothetical protein SAMN02745691_01960 [Parasporobacterium paucivorans DSM 15970]
MKKRLFVVFDMEESYSLRLVSFLIDMAGNIFDIRGFTDVEEFRRFCHEKEVEILLINEESLPFIEAEGMTARFILLKECAEMEMKFPYPGVYKYQPADQLIKEVLELCPLPEERDFFNRKEGGGAKILGVYSPVNGCGKTSFALSLTHMYSKNGTALYINLEDYSGLSKLLSSEFSNDISDLFYFYKQSHEKLSAKLFSTILTRHDIDIIPPIRYCRDLRNLEPEEWRDFICRIAEVSGYEIIVLDLSNMVGDVIPLLEMCRMIYMPVKRNELARARVQEFQEYVKNIGKEELLLKTKQMEIPGGYFLHTGNHYIESLLLSPFAGYVKDMAEEGEELWTRY